MMRTQTYKDGKAVDPKKQVGLTNAQIVKSFARQLHVALQERRIELRELDSQDSIEQALTKQIQRFWNEIHTVIDATFKINDRITKSLMRAIGKLNADLASFEDAIDNSLGLNSPDDLLLGMSLAELCGDVRHFTHQVELTHTSVASVSLNEMPNRPTDWNKKSLFEQLVSEYQRQHGPKKYPPYKVMAKIMEHSGFDLKERTYGDWKTQHRKGTFHHLIQAREFGNKYGV